MAHGPISMLSEEAPTVVERAAHLEGLTSDELRWVGREVVLHSEHGAVCKGIVEGVEVVGRFHMSEDIQAEWFDEEGHLTVGQDEALSRAWEMAPKLGSLDLTGQIRVLSGDCDGAIWAQLSDDVSPPVVAAEPASPELERLALDAVQATERYREMQQSYEEFRKEAPEDWNTAGFPEKWENYNGAVSVTLVAHPSGETLIATSLRAGEGCGDFLGATFHLWRLDGDRLEEIPAEGLDADSTITGAADVDGDGQIDLLTPGGYVRQTRNGFDETRSTTLPANLGCGC